MSIYRLHCSSRLFNALVPVLIALCCVSCTQRRAAVYPVEGKVYFQGRPAAGAVVIFHPAVKDGSGGFLLLPQGMVGPDGSFHLTTYEEDDGAPAGEYAVTVIWRRPGAEKDDDPQEILPPRYLNPATSGLKAHVQAAIQLEPFQLTSAGQSGGSYREERGGRR